MPRIPFASLPCLASCLVCVSGGLIAQTTVVKGAAPSGLVRNMNNGNNSSAVTIDGMVWTIIYEADSQGTKGHLSLRRSIAQGDLWLAVDDYPLPNNTSHNNHHNNSGCVVPGRDGISLHVTWADKTANALYWSAMYQVFDTRTRSFRGAPQLLAAGTGANNQFWPVDIAMTPKGTVAVCISGHRRGGLGLGIWDCGLAIRKPGGSFNTTLLNLRSGGGSYSQNASIVAVDERIHCNMKNAVGAYGITYRSYDTEKNAWDQSTQVAVGPSNNSGIAAGNKSVIAADDQGGLYVLYVTGNTTAPRTLRMAYAKPGTGSLNSDWSDIHVIPHTTTIGTNHRGVATNSGAYPLLQGGNTTYRNYSLSPTAGGGMTVVYSKPFEAFANLYVQEFRAGASVLPEVKLSAAGTKPYAFEWVSGLRNGDQSYVAAWTSYGKTDAPTPFNGPYPNGQVDYWRMGGAIARSIAYGTGCQGQLSKLPRVHARGSRPSLGKLFQLELDRFPGSANFFLAVGVTPALPPLNLAIMGAPDCELNTTYPLIVSGAVNSSGELKVSWNVPNDRALLGAAVYCQCLVLVPGSAPGGVVTTNALCVVLGD